MSRRGLSPHALADLDAVVRADLRVVFAAEIHRGLPLENTAESPEAVLEDEALLRDLSARLRRLVEEGKLQLLRTNLGYRGEPRMTYIPLDLRGGPRFAMAGPGTKGPGVSYDMASFDRLLSDEEIRQLSRGSGQPQPIEVTMSRWRTSTCMIVDDVKVTRSNVIKYVANKLGGVHFDERRHPEKERAYIALDASRSNAALGLNAPYFAFLSIIEQFKSSVGVVELLRT